MKRIETDIIQKKRKAILKNLKSKPIQPNKQANRSLSESIDVSTAIQKAAYVQTLAKLSDRYVPVLKNYGDLESFLQFLEGDLNIKNGLI